MPKFLKAYTTLEVLVVIGLMVLITGMVIPVSLRQTKLNELTVSGKDLHSSIFLQQQNAYSGKNNSNHGIYIESNGYWLFEGESFATSTSKDYMPFGKGIFTTTGNVEILFEQNSQEPDTEKIIVLTYSGYSYRIRINSEGSITSYAQT